MENFKEIADKCLAGELSGIFVLRNGDKCISSNFKKDQSLLTSFRYLEHFYYSDSGHCYTMTGRKSKFDIVDFISDNMQEQIKIDIPEDKVPVVEQTEKGVVITWKEKELTYKDIENKIILKNSRDCIIGYTPVIEDIKTLNCPHSDFYKKVEVLRKLTNIRNYFGKPKVSYDGVVITCEFGEPIIVSAKVCPIECSVIFAKKEHAEQAIKMLGDELKYLFEPW